MWAGGAPDLAAWWSEDGRAGGVPGGGLATGFPRALAGLAVGGWGFEDPDRPTLGRPWPGLLGVAPALSFYDTLAFAGAAGPAGGDWARALARGMSASQPRAAGPRTRAVFGLRSGDPEVDEATLVVARRAAGWNAGVEMLSGTRGPSGALGRAGRHLWGASASARLGAHRLALAGSQRGAASALASGEGQAGHAGSGAAAWRWEGAARWAGARLERAYTAHESYSGFFATSRRDADRLGAVLEGGARGAAGQLAARVEVARERVRRDVDPAFERRATATWAGLAATRPLGEGMLELEGGGGWHERLDAAVFAPAARYRFAAGPARGGVGLERLVRPLWSDLAPGVEPFLQDTWALGMEAAWERPGSARLAARSWFGRTRDRAVVARLPLEDLWLRLGVARDPERWDFALLVVGGAWRAGALAAGAEGFALARDRGALQPAVDPGAGFRAHAEWGVALFQRDLDVRLRAEAAGVGSRESEGAVPRRLAGYVTWGAAAALTLADVTLTLRARNLEDRVREQPWIDLVTGREALGPARTVESTLVWRLLD